MKKRKLFCLALAAVLLCPALGGCGRKAAPVPPIAGDAAEGRELMGEAATREDAEALAALYGIELVSWSGRLAVFHTEEDPAAVIRRGRENGWPALEINHVITLDDP